MKKLKKNQGRGDQLHLSAAILTRWQCPVASTKALDLLHRAMCTVLYRRTAVVIKMASKVGVFFHHHFVCCCLGGCWGNTEQVVTQWRHPVASGVALDMPHGAMLSVLLWRSAMAIEMANNGSAFAHRCCLFCIIIHSYKTILWSLKLMPSYNINLTCLVSLFV
jgi:hypothetical protein